MNPKVSFIVPCYKLAHLLPECVNSILAQTYRDFEVLIMDDCSPDNTPEVARSFADPRVKHVRNEPNLGHLRNYNKGIELSRGEYIWLISADDRLRKPYALEHYVDFMEAHPKIGFVFCPAMGLQDGIETGIVRWTYSGDRQNVSNGLDFLVHSLLPKGGGIAAPAVMARKECYEKASWFPLDMPHQGDAYLWGMWMLQYDVGYLPEPLVHYRLHGQSMMATFKREDANIVLRDELAVLWRMKRELQKRGFIKEAQIAIRHLIAKYVSTLVAKYQGANLSVCQMTLEECDKSVADNAENPKEGAEISARARAGLADHYVWNNDLGRARDLYVESLHQYPWMPSVWGQYALLCSGVIGSFLRKALGAVRRVARGTQAERGDSRIRTVYRLIGAGAGKAMLTRFRGNAHHSRPTARQDG